jgi:type IV secretion system protein VirB5
LAVTAIAASASVEAIIPVTDVGAIVQLVMQLQTLEQEVETARQTLDQARSEYQSMTGDRGMQRLLSGVDRNYLPATWGDIQSLQGSASGLASAVRQKTAAATVLTEEQLGALAPEARQSLEADRQSVAVLQTLSQQALATASSRFASLQSLIDAVGSAGDQKAALDLQARVGAELAMLQNEQIKLQMVFQTWQADQISSEQRSREQAIAQQGNFATRFQPVP